MRKIEYKMIEAINAAMKGKRNFKDGNTAVTFNESNHAIVTLYGHNIARIIDARNNFTVMINLCGYNTVTTRSRLTAILFTYKPGINGVGTKKGQACIVYRDGHTADISDTAWHSV